MNKKHISKLLLCLSMMATLLGCGSQLQQSNDNNVSLAMVDKQATAETRALLVNLYKLRDQHMLFGHQDTLAYGVHWQDEEGRSDIKDVSGSFPALYGWEIGGLAKNEPVNLDKVDFAKMQRWIREIYLRGGVSTISWHMYDPVTGDNSWSKAPSVKRLIPGGDHHEKFKQYLDTFVNFNRQLVVTDNTGEQVQVPIIFRPWHEHTGEWFWWGKGHTEEQDYISLWRFTVDYFKQQGVHNLIYTYSPDRGRIDLDNYAEDYLYGYPGDDYVDILGIDTYKDLGRDPSVSVEQQKHDFRRTLEYTVELANQRHKLAAVSEGGWDGLTDDNYWTDRILDVVKSNEKTRQIAYLMVWRNANKAREQRDHYYGPYPGHVAADNFKQFRGDSFTLFEDDLPPLYRG